MQPGKQEVSWGNKGKIISLLAAAALLVLMGGSGCNFEPSAGELYLEDLEAIDAEERINSLNHEVGSIWISLGSDFTFFEFEDIPEESFQEAREEIDDWMDKYDVLWFELLELDTTDPEVKESHQYLEELMQILYQYAEATGEFIDLSLELKDLFDNELTQAEADRAEAIIDEVDEIDAQINGLDNNFREIIPLWEESLINLQ